MPFYCTSDAFPDLFSIFTMFREILLKIFMTASINQVIYKISSFSKLCRISMSFGCEFIFSNYVRQNLFGYPWLVDIINFTLRYFFERIMFNT